MEAKVLSLAEQRKVLMELRRDQQMLLNQLKREDAVNKTPGKNDEYIQDVQANIDGINQIYVTLQGVEAMLTAQAQLTGLLRPSAE